MTYAGTKDIDFIQSPGAEDEVTAYDDPEDEDEESEEEPEEAA